MHASGMQCCNHSVCSASFMCTCKVSTETSREQLCQTEDFNSWADAAKTKQNHLHKPGSGVTARRRNTAGSRSAVGQRKVKLSVSGR
jgi:hypothetical protein